MLLILEFENKIKKKIKLNFQFLKLERSLIINKALK